jgi:hypothetical protein
MIAICGIKFFYKKSLNREFTMVKARAERCRISRLSIARKDEVGEDPATPPTFQLGVNHGVVATPH